MKLYKNTTKRIAKKQNRHFWRKLNYAKNLKIGDLVSTCKGYNERIKEIYPEWTKHNLSKGSYIYDFDIVTESGDSCSIIHCCTFPLETKKQVAEYWSWFNTPGGKEWVEQCGCKSDNKIADALAKGIDPFDEDGQLLYEYCRDYEKKARFLERWREMNIGANDPTSWQIGKTAASIKFIKDIEYAKIDLENNDLIKKIKNGQIVLTEFVEIDNFFDINEFEKSISG